jgi:hypothetical protein
MRKSTVETKEVIDFFDIFVDNSDFYPAKSASKRGFPRQATIGVGCSSCTGSTTKKADPGGEKGYLGGGQVKTNCLMY